MSLQLNKQRVASNFSRAAQGYDEVAQLQRRVALQLLQHLPGKNDLQRVVDIGTGTGFLLAHLRACYPRATLVALDLALGMLQQARQRCHNQGAVPICADAEHLPLAAESCDLLVSSMALQWCTQPQQLFAEFQRVLKPGGRAVFSTLGPQTLHELRDAWAQLDSQPHVNRYPDADLLLAQCGCLRIEQVECQREVLHYAQLTDLMRELKQLGAHHVDGRRPGLTGAGSLTALISAYERWRDELGRLPATYEVYYITLCKESV